MASLKENIRRKEILYTETRIGGNHTRKQNQEHNQYNKIGR
jgi:hypothetical protein